MGGQGWATETPTLPEGNDVRALARRIEVFGRWRRWCHAELLRWLPAAAGELLLCVPYLLHRNDPGLPGYQEDPTPAGLVEPNLLPPHRAALQKLLGLRERLPTAPTGQPAFLALLAEPDRASRVRLRPRIRLLAFVTPEAVRDAVPTSLLAKTSEIERWAAARDVELEIVLRTPPLEPTGDNRLPTVGGH